MDWWRPTKESERGQKAADGFAVREGWGLPRALNGGFRVDIRFFSSSV